MRTYTFPMQMQYGREELVLTEEELRAAGFFECPNDLSRELRLWEIADERLSEDG